MKNLGNLEKNLAVIPFLFKKKIELNDLTSVYRFLPKNSRRNGLLYLNTALNTALNQKEITELQRYLYMRLSYLKNGMFRRLARFDNKMYCMEY